MPYHLMTVFYRVFVEIRALKYARSLDETVKFGSILYFGSRPMF